LVEFGINHSEKSAQYMNFIYAQSTLDILLKFSCIVAVFTRGEKNITSQDVKTAYMDLFEIMSSMFDTIDKYTEDFYSYDISYIDLLVLRWLKKQQNKVNVQTITHYINGLDGGHINTSIKKYQHLVRKGFLKVKHGKSEAEISLTEKSLELLKNENMLDDKYYEEYYKICKEVNEK
jgi:predicted transcriptional regulator